uniref:Uncharacterized protein n=1 Tax=Romanomermis culicivorax TaxID=13658 RepID=A0A915KXE6_ROMCU
MNRTSGTARYLAICQKIAKGVVREKQLYYDKKRVSPYYWYNDKTAGPQWMGFDDLHSYKTKLVRGIYSDQYRLAMLHCYWLGVSPHLSGVNH